MIVFFYILSFAFNEFSLIFKSYFQKPIIILLLLFENEN